MHAHAYTHTLYMCRYICMYKRVKVFMYRQSHTHAYTNLYMRGLLRLLFGLLLRMGVLVGWGVGDGGGIITFFV